MKRKLLVPVCLSMATLAMAQANGYPIGSTVANFTVTDTDGNSHSLYDITGSGKYVVLDFFFAACPPCQQTQPIFNQLHETYGCNQHDLFVMSINNGQDNNAEVIAYEQQYGGSSAHSPAVSNQGGGPAVDDVFGVAQYPTYVLIGPDNVMINNDIWPINSMQNFVSAFPAGGNIQPASCMVNVAENSMELPVQVYPVPSTGQLWLELPLSGHGHFAEVHDALGRLMHTENFTESAGVRSQDKSKLAEGSYTHMDRDSAGNSAMKRIIIAR